MIFHFRRFDAVDHPVEDARLRWSFARETPASSLSELVLLLFWKASYRLRRHVPGLRDRLNKSILDVYLGARIPNSSLRAQVVALRNQAQYRTVGAGIDVGYAPDEPVAKWAVLSEWYNGRPQKRLHMQMYLKVTSLADLKDKRVLEVGCGQGDGAAFLTEVRTPAKYIGIDLHPAQVALCRERFKQLAPRLVFNLGDAQRLPVRDRVFDLALSVESSHSYPRFDSFVNEVYRVLLPGGLFCFADLRAPSPGEECAAQLRRTFEQSGFTVIHHEDITNNAFRSIDELRTAVGGHLWDEFESLRTLFSERKLEYHFFVLSKRPA